MSSTWLPFERELMRADKTLTPQATQDPSRRLLPARAYEATSLAERFGKDLATLPPLRRRVNWRPEDDLIWLHSPEPCFMCGKPTTRLDIDYGAPYCGLDDDRIRHDLSMLAIEYHESDRPLVGAWQEV
jgi:hypothetical protein